MKTKNGNVAVSKKTPEYMTKNGSIFNAQNTNQISGTNARVQSRGIQGNQTGRGKRGAKDDLSYGKNGNRMRIHDEERMRVQWGKLPCHC